MGRLQIAEVTRKEYRPERKYVSTAATSIKPWMSLHKALDDLDSVYTYAGLLSMRSALCTRRVEKGA